jgi:hypothetical protein
LPTFTHTHTRLHRLHPRRALPIYHSLPLSCLNWRCVLRQFVVTKGPETACYCHVVADDGGNYDDDVRGNMYRIMGTFLFNIRWLVDRRMKNWCWAVRKRAELECSLPGPMAGFDVPANYERAVM